MSYAIILNQTHKRESTIKLCTHVERKKSKYNNKNINIEKIKDNYHLKELDYPSYIQAIRKIIQQDNLTFNVKKSSVYICEYITTSDTKFFNEQGEEDTKRYFKECYNFLKTYNNLKEKYVLSAVVHMDEKTPHMHMIYIPVVNSIDKNFNLINKISMSEFWKDRDAYSKLQEDFYNYIKGKGFNLKRGQKKRFVHMDMESLKLLTNFYKTKDLEEKLEKEPVQTIKEEEIENFYKTKEFTMKNVKEYLIEPMIKENKRLVDLNKKMQLIISKAKNCIEYLKNIEQKNNRLKEQLKHQIEINRNIEERNNNLIRFIKEKFNIPIGKIRKIETNNKDKIKEEEKESII